MLMHHLLRPLWLSSDRYPASDATNIILHPDHYRFGQSPTSDRNCLVLLNLVPYIRESNIISG
jgi:hypothetical protein